MNPQIYFINGRVIDRQTRQGISGLRVEAWDKDLIFDDLVGSAETDRQGRFSISFSSEYFSEIFIDRRPDLFFKVFYKDKLIRSTEDSILWNTKAGDKVITIEVDFAGTEEVKVIKIYGKIILEDRRPAKNIGLRFYRYFFGGKSRKVAETRTDEKGQYRIKLKKDDKALIIEVKAVDGENKEISLSEPITDFEREEKVEINLVAPASLSPLEPEFTRLQDAIKALKIKNLKDAKENEERQDLSFLNRSTGWDARLIALAADAQRISEYFRITGEFKPKLVSALKSMAKAGFRIGQTPVETFMKNIQDENLKKQIEEVKHHIKALHRIYQITPTDEAMPVLSSLNLTSAQAVTALPEEEFVKRFEGEYEKIHGTKPPKNVARLVYRKAEQVENTVFNIATTARWLGSAPPIHVLPYFGEAKGKVIKELPTLEKLFGFLDFCECEHCHSVLSPAAYLVDLLHSLERWGEKIPDSNKRPYKVLTDRRPDIPHIPLTCENTYTTMPYIDIVNEILEYWVVHNKLDANAARDTGSATSEELIAEPQYIEPQAYESLQNARYPLNLLFDLWIETAREFCNYFEIPLWRLLEVFRPTNNLFNPGELYDYSKIFIEQLGLSPSEFELFIEEKILNRWYELYGYNYENNALSELSSAKTLSRRLGITYKELVEVLKTWLVNPKLNEAVILYKLNINPVELSSLKEEELKDIIEKYAEDNGLTDEEKEGLFNNLKNIPLNKILFLADEKATCDFEKTKVIYGDGSRVEPIDFLKINLFVRLWKKLGWNIEELDRALQTFIPQNTPFDEPHLSRQPLKTALIYLAHLKFLEEKLNLGKDERIKLLTLWSDIPTTGENSLYKQLFLKPDILKTDSVFDHPLGLYLQGDVIHPLKPHLPALQAALGLTADEIELILKDNEKSIDSNLTLENVSLLYRYGLLAKALKISVSELISLKKLSGINPFMPISKESFDSLDEDAPYQTLRFIEIVEKVKESGFKIEDLNYLFFHQFDPTGKYRPDIDGTRLFLRTLADGIRSIKAEYAIPVDSSTLSEDMLKQKLGLILPPEVVERFLAMLNRRAEFTAVKEEVDKDNKLNPETFKDESSIVEVLYEKTDSEENKGKQSLTYKGVLFEDIKNELIDKYNNKLSNEQLALFTTLLHKIQNQAEDFFDTWLKRSDEDPTTGFFDEQDYGWLFVFPFTKKWSEVSDLESIGDTPAEVPESIKNILEGRGISLKATAKIEKIEDNLWQIQDNGRILRIHKANDNEKVEFTFNRKKLIAETFFPYLQSRLIKDLVVKRLAEKRGADSSLVEMLITNTDMLSLSDEKPSLIPLFPLQKKELLLIYMPQMIAPVIQPQNLLMMRIQAL